MECCGTPFKIGDSIEWHVISADRLIRPFDIDGLEYAYDAHFDDWDGIYTLKGVVNYPDLKRSRLQPNHLM